MSNVAVYQELDVNIDALLAGAEVKESADPTMRELMTIARELRAMPSPEFRDRLAEELDAVVVATREGNPQVRQHRAELGHQPAELGHQPAELGHRDERDL